MPSKQVLSSRAKKAIWLSHSMSASLAYHHIKSWIAAVRKMRERYNKWIEQERLDFLVQGIQSS